MEDLEGLILFNPEFYEGKRVLVTGHTGFKGSWMTVLLLKLGAEVAGYSLCTSKEISLFDQCGIKKEIRHCKGDVRDLDAMSRVFESFQPEIVIHMAAQPIVREGYVIPEYTYGTNVMGTVNLLECVRHCKSVKSVIVVTTDKVYKNKEWEWGYRENDELNGYDPYSNSKSCAELVTETYRNCFFKESPVSISAARAGNVIGGGDFAKDRIIPECVKAALGHKEMIIRNPDSVRPYQHVLEPICAYLMLAEGQYRNPALQGNYNIGPDVNSCIRTEELVRMFNTFWGGDLRISIRNDFGPHESGILKLDCTRIKDTFCWTPRWDIQTALRKIVEWTKEWMEGNNVRKIMERQMDDYLNIPKGEFI